MGEARRKRERREEEYKRKVLARSDSLSLDRKINALHKLIDQPKMDAIKLAFPPGTWVFGIGPHKGCSEVFEGSAGDLQPFDYLCDYDLTHYRVATPEEVMEAMDRVMRQRIEHLGVDQ